LVVFSVGSTVHTPTATVFPSGLNWTLPIRLSIQHAISWQPGWALGLPGSSITHSGRSWDRVAGEIVRSAGASVGEGERVAVGSEAMVSVAAVVLAGDSVLAAVGVARADVGVEGAEQPARRIMSAGKRRTGARKAEDPGARGSGMGGASFWRR
jgi:hypothetical protein